MAATGKIARVLNEFASSLIKSGDEDVAGKVARKAAELGASDEEVRAATRGLTAAEFEATAPTQRPSGKQASVRDLQFPSEGKVRTTEAAYNPTQDGVPAGKQLQVSKGGLPVAGAPVMEAEYIPPPKGRGNTDLVLSKRPAQEGKRETGLVPSGQGRTTFITDEQGRTSAGTQPPKAEPRTLEERIARETEAKAQSEAEQAIPESYKSRGLAIPLAGATTLAGALTRDQNGKEPGEVPAGAETAKEVKLAPPAAPTPKGGVGTKPTDTQPVTPGKESQATTTQAIAGAAKLSDKVAASKSGAASKPTLDELTGYLDSVAKDVNNDPRFNNTNIERDLLAARADAYKMYKEKADRNQLLGTVERAINAIAQFASAQAGFGTRQAGGNLPLSSVDYGGQTAQAFKEYETEVGLIGEEQKAGERASDRKEALKEKEVGRRQKTIQEQIETERDVLKEAAAEKRARIGAESREDIAKLRASLPKAPSPAKISGIDSEIRTTQAAIKEASKFASAASNDAASKALAGFLTATGLSPEEVDTEIKTRSAGFFTGPSKREARQQFASERMQELRDRLDSLKSQRVELLTGQVSAYTEVESAPAGQAPANGGMVTVILDGKRGQIPSSQLPAFTKKHPNAIVE